MQSIAEDQTITINAEAIDIASTPTHTIKRQSSSSGSGSMLVVDGTPEPDNDQEFALDLFTIEKGVGAASAIEFSPSIADDVEDILEMKEKEFKGVNFRLSTPKQV